MKPARIVPLAALVALGACATDGPAAPAVVDRDSSAVIVTTTTNTTTTTTTTTSSGDPASPAPTPETVAASTDPPETTTTVPAPVVGEPVVAAEAVGEFDQPLDLAIRNGDDALYIVEQGGGVVRWDGASTVVADVSDRISGANEQGLLGLAFSPDGDLAYLDYTDRSGTTTIAEYPVAPDGTIDVAAERVVLTVDQPFRNHNAGDLAFGPDGMLYITLGDGGAADDPGRRASDPSQLLGSLLRIDPTPDGDAPYTIPADNPFATGPFEGVEGAPEVWAWGLRNPWRIAFDPITDDLWIADVGQNEFEEINVVGPEGDIPAGRGADFGWSAFEGTERFNTDVAATERMIPPVLTYRHGADGCSVSGGVPYRGTAIPELEPAYVYSDFCSGVLWALDLDGGRNLTLMTGFDAVTAVRAGPDGELYVLERSGTVHRLVTG